MNERESKRPPGLTAGVVPLTQEQVDYITVTTNDRGANFSSKPYFFMQTSLVGGGDWLNIVVQFIGSGALKGGSVKARSGVLDGTVSDAFKALVAQTLAKVER